VNSRVRHLDELRELTAAVGGGGNLLWCADTAAALDQYERATLGVPQSAEGDRREQEQVGRR